MQLVETKLGYITPPQTTYEPKESWMAVGHADDQTTHLATYGLYVCKGITIYDPVTGRGLLAHLGYTEDVDTSLAHILEVNDNELDNSDIHIVRATQDKEVRFWPELDAITEFFMRHNPRSLTVDRNVTGSEIRAIALDLRSGAVGEVSVWNGRGTVMEPRGSITPYPILSPDSKLQDYEVEQAQSREQKIAHYSK